MRFLSCLHVLAALRKARARVLSLSFVGFLALGGLPAAWGYSTVQLQVGGSTYTVAFTAQRSYNQCVNAIRGSAWWGNSTLAQGLAAALGGRFGAPTAGTYGPLFGFKLDVGFPVDNAAWNTGGSIAVSNHNGWPVNSNGVWAVDPTQVDAASNCTAADLQTAPPYVQSVTPPSGPLAGGTAITITGSIFTGATSVTIGGNPATGVTVVDDSTITATTPAGTVGAKSVVVTGPSGSNAANTLFTYDSKTPQAALTVIATPASLAVGANATLSTSGGSGSGAVTYQVLSGPCSRSGSTLTGVAAGTCSVQASKAADATYSIGTATTNVTVSTGIHGACGSAIGVATANAPAANLCSTGTATGVVGSSGQWQWGCNGSGGGTSTAANACTAPYASQTLSISASPTSILVGGTSAMTASSTAGLSVGLAGNAHCTVSGSTATGTNAGTCTVTASQAGTGDAGTHRYLAAADKTVNISVNAVPVYPITATASPAAGGSVTCSPISVAHGGSSTCTATAHAGYIFGSFSGDCTGATCALTNVTSAKSVTALFTQSVTGITLPEGPQVGQPLGVQLAPGNGWVIDSAGTQSLASLGAPSLPPGWNAPHGVVALHLIGGTAGTSAAVVLSYPHPLPAGTVYYKYGKTAGNPTAHWYLFGGASISGNTITLTLTDGADGDDDLAANSAITDPGGPVVPLGAPLAAAAIPTLSQWALVLLSLVLAGAAMTGVRRRLAGRS